jgi:HJR/Mrr/RecB family endonuclease
LNQTSIRHIVKQYIDQSYEDSKDNHLTPSIIEFIISYLRITYNLEVNESDIIPIYNEEIKLYKENLRFETQVTPFVNSFVQNSIKMEGIWLSNEPISNEDIESFLLYLHEKNINISLEYLLDRVAKESSAYYTQHFTSTFLRLNPDVEFSNDPNKWVKAYIETFENNKEFSDYVYFLFMNLRAKDIAEKGIITETNYEQFKLDGFRELIEAEIRKTSIRIKIKENLQLRLNGEIINKSQIQDVDLMTGREFELFLQKVFSRLGYHVEVTQATSDQGGDLVIEKFGERCLVQAKRYSNNVSNSAIQEAFTARNFYNCQSCMVVTNSYFTKSAIELAEANKVKLWNRDKLNEIILTYL